MIDLLTKRLMLHITLRFSIQHSSLIWFTCPSYYCLTSSHPEPPSVIVRICPYMLAHTLYVGCHLVCSIIIHVYPYWWLVLSSLSLMQSIAWSHLSTEATNCIWPHFLLIVFCPPQHFGLHRLLLGRPRHLVLAWPLPELTWREWSPLEGTNKGWG